MLLRGDVDALPMPEETGLDYASKTAGLMHACGHDSHTAMLVGAARLLCARQHLLSGNVMFMFQPGEEGYHGARYMIEDGLLDPLPDAAFAIHMQPNGPYGVFTGRAGSTLASADVISVTITGRGGHASMPHESVDPVPIACEIVTAIQSMVTRRVNVFDPAVVTIGKIEAGTTNNVIPDTAHLLGTMRTVSVETRVQVKNDLRRLVTGIAAAHGAAANVDFDEGYPSVQSDVRAVSLGRSTAADLFGDEAWVDMAAPHMGAEDFAYVLQKVPGAFYFLGAAHAGTDWKTCCGMHSTQMVIDESVMAKGVAFHAALALRFLSQPGWDKLPVQPTPL